MTRKVGQRRKGVKASLIELSKEESMKFPRRSYSSVRTIMSTMKIEYPERVFVYDIVEDGILVTCLK